MMFGYWKAVAIHLRKIYREIRRDFISQELGFVLPIQRPAFYEATRELREVQAEVECQKRRITELLNERSSLQYDLNRTKKALTLAEERLAIRSVEAA
jgi:septal ring factor EnvC (AmiA/AmiB activator)